MCLFSYFLSRLLLIYSLAHPWIVLEIYASTTLSLLAMTAKYRGSILQGKKVRTNVILCIHFKINSKEHEWLWPLPLCLQKLTIFAFSPFWLTLLSPYSYKNHTVSKYKETRWDIKASYAFIIKMCSTETQIVTAIDFWSLTFWHHIFIY